MPRLIWFFAEHTSHILLVLSCSGSLILLFWFVIHLIFTTFVLNTKSQRIRKGHKTYLCPAKVKLIIIPNKRTIHSVSHNLSHLMTKPTKWHVRPAKTQISLGIHPVWSESSMSACRKLGSPATHWAHSEDSDQTGRMPRLIWVFAGRTGFVMRGLILIQTALW